MQKQRGQVWVEGWGRSVTDIYLHPLPSGTLKRKWPRCRWLMSIILATQEAEIGGSQFKARPGS
jgi:hypothetical protein